MICCICQKELPNKWAIGKRETVDGVERFYCQLHANENFKEKKPLKEAVKKGESMEENKVAADEAKEQEIVKKATGELAKKAWAECSSLAGKLGGGVKMLWSKIHPDRSPEAMLSALNDNLAGNKQRLSALKPELDGVYREIVAKKKDYIKAPPARQRILKIELQTLMAKYKSLEREFSILSENERSIEAVKGRFLEVLAYGLRGKLNADMVDGLADQIDDKADEAEDIQDSLADLERAGRRKDRDAGDFDAELGQFDGELGLADDITNNETTIKENNHETEQNTRADADRDPLADFGGGDLA